jgi:hypothetical protein
MGLHGLRISEEFPDKRSGCFPAMETHSQIDFIGDIISHRLKTWKNWIVQKNFIFRDINLILTSFINCTLENGLTVRNISTYFTTSFFNLCGMLPSEPPNFIKLLSICAITNIPLRY